VYSLLDYRKKKFDKERKKKVGKEERKTIQYSYIHTHTTI